MKFTLKYDTEKLVFFYRYGLTNFIIMEVTLFLVNGKLVSKVSKGVVPEAFLFATDGREYLVPLLEKVPFRLTYRDAVGQAEEIEILKCPCSLMPGNDLEALLKNIVEINNMRKGFGLKEIPSGPGLTMESGATGNRPNYFPACIGETERDTILKRGTGNSASTRPSE